MALLNIASWQQVKSVNLSRTACNAISSNADKKKPVVKSAREYFISNTNSISTLALPKAIPRQVSCNALWHCCSNHWRQNSALMPARRLRAKSSWALSAAPTKKRTDCWPSSSTNTTRRCLTCCTRRLRSPSSIVIGRPASSTKKGSAPTNAPFLLFVSCSPCTISSQNAARCGCLCCRWL